MRTADGEGREPSSLGRVRWGSGRGWRWRGGVVVHIRARPSDRRWCSGRDGRVLAGRRPFVILWRREDGREGWPQRVERVVLAYSPLSVRELLQRSPIVVVVSCGSLPPVASHPEVDSDRPRESSAPGSSHREIRHAEIVPVLIVVVRKVEIVFDVERLAEWESEAVRRMMLVHRRGSLAEMMSSGGPEGGEAVEMLMVRRRGRGGGQV